VGVGTGARVVDVGCGPEGCLGLLATRVGPSGTVVGVERNPDDVELARAMVRARDLRNVEVRHSDGRATGLPRSAFDVATARLVLVNVPQPEEIVGEAFALVRSGGTVAFHEFDWVASLCDPPCDEWSRAVELLESYSRANGIDLYVGRTLPRLLREAGLIDVQINPLVHVYPPGHGRRSILVDFLENLTDRMIAGGFVTHDELESLEQAIAARVADPEQADQGSSRVSV
jgi:SAM-dependent methyltransferase